MQESDFDEVADLIFHSTNGWYRKHLGREIFQGQASDCRVFCEVYEALDPGCGIVLESSGRMVGSCFFHPRETHSSLGIMNVHPDYFGQGVAGKLITKIVEMAEARKLPLRLVSSALSLDSFSLYSRAGFVPTMIFQDLLLKVPVGGLGGGAPDKVRLAKLSDVEAMGELEEKTHGIRREKDYRHFIENPEGFWKVYVSIGEDGCMNGFLASSDHPASTMIGPGVSANSVTMEALLLAQFKHFKGRQVLFLLPSSARDLIEKAYGWGARNCELHFGQVRGENPPVDGIVLPAFLPETG